VRFAALDALRGVCALLVALFHFNFQGEGAIAGVQAVQKGWLFVDFFFVLSGFVLAHAYWGRIGGEVGPWRFLGLRLGRIYPLHLAVLLAMIVLELAGTMIGRDAFAGDRSVDGLVASLLLLHSSGATGGLVWNSPSWSIAAEFWAYVLFAALALTGRVWLFVPAGLVGLALVATAPVELHDATFGFGTARCVFGFSLGVLLWAYAGRPRFGTVTATAAEAGVLLAVWLLATFVWTGWPPLLGPPLFALAVLVFAAEAGLVSRLLKTRAFLALGTLSYSIYMVHPFVQARLMEALARVGLAATGRPDRLLVTGVAADAVVMLMLAAVIATAALTYRWIERPVRGWSRRRLHAPAVEKVAPTF
jgi:peptidoglycan/LPS O-acetylase OafA/YrhL